MPQRTSPRKRSCARAGRDIDSRHDGAGVQLVADFCATLSGGSETNREPANREPRLLYRLHGNLTVGAFT